jgi:hypothetical protein
VDQQSREYWTQLGAQTDAPILAELEALEGELSPETFRRVLGLAGKVDTASQRWTLRTAGNGAEAVDELARDHRYSADLQERMRALTRQLSAEQVDALGRVVCEVDNEAYDRARHDVEQETAAILKHFPGLEVAWGVVWAHLEGAHYPACIDHAKVTLHNERCKWFPPPE